MSQIPHYISNILDQKNQVLPWLNRLNLFESKCQRCKELTEVYKVYSYMDRSYLTLCILDIYKHYEVGFMKMKKSGEIPSKHPLDTSWSPRKKSWSIYFFCPNCSENHNSYFVGHSTPEPGGIYKFSGNCNQCGYFISGDTHDLSEEGKKAHASNEEHNRRLAEMKQEVFAKSPEGLKLAQASEDSINLIIQSRRSNKNKSTQVFNKPESSPRPFIKLFCSNCLKERPFDSLHEVLPLIHESFVGKCRICQQILEGSIENLQKRSVLDSKEFKLQREKEIDAKNAQFAQEYAEGFLKRLRNKRNSS